MIGRRPQPLRRWLSSRFSGVSAARFGRRAASSAPLRRALARRTRAPRLSTPMVVASPPPAPTLRLSLVLSRRLVITGGPGAPAPTRQPPSAPLLHAAGVASTHVERLVSRVQHHATRIERSTQLVHAPYMKAATGGAAGTRSRAPEPAPRLVAVRTAASQPAEAPSPAPTPATAVPHDSAAAWKQPGAAVLAEDVLRELDRRIIAERERRGRLA